MFSKKDRLKAVKLFLKYDHSYAAVIHELGYPSVGALRHWYQEYKNTGKLKEKQNRRSKYSTDQKQKAVDHYFEHGKCYARTIRILGYPDKETLRKWCVAARPETNKICQSTVKLTEKQKVSLLRKAYQSKTSKKDLAQTENISRTSLYQWKDEYLGKDFPFKMKEPANKKEELLKEIKALQKQVQDLQLEKALLEKAAEILKKDDGINLADLSNQDKTSLINALRKHYKLKTLLERLKLSKSSYFYQYKVLSQPQKYISERKLITAIFEDNFCSYGYRRIYQSLKALGKKLSEKVIRHLMKEEKLLVKISKRRKYSSYAGEITQAAPNYLKRNFKAARPNEKWLTDLTEFRIPAGKVYLSPLVDCYDGAVISWTIGTQPNADLVNKMLDTGILQLKENEKPIIHSDRGAHYRWPEWIKKVKAAGLIRSMSKKGCSPDNSACEGFFGRLKNEMFYNHDWSQTTLKQFIKYLDGYLHWYNEKRMKISLGGISPLQYREQNGYN